MLPKSDINVTVLYFYYDCLNYNMYYILKSSDVSNNVITSNHIFDGNYSLHSLTFTNNVYNITSNNNILPYQEGASYYAIELTEQFVNGDDLATHLKAKIDAVSAGTSTVSFDANTGKFTISNTTNFYLKFGDITTNTCHNLLGFNQSNTSNGTSIVSDVACDLVPFKQIYVRIKEHECGNVRNENNNTYTFLILGNSNFGDIFTYTSKEHDVIPQTVQLDAIKRLTIEFYDENNNSISLANWCLGLIQIP